MSDHRTIRRAIAEKRWAAVINAAAFTAVDRAEEERDLAFAVNAAAPSHLAEACAEGRIPLVHISTDYVFDGAKISPYVETDHVGPLSIYGLSKEAGEAAIRERHPMHVILRTSWVFSAAGQNFVKTMLRLGRERPALSIVVDQFGRPTAAADIASAIARIVTAIGDGKHDGFGTFHFANAGATTWHAFAKEVFKQASLRGLTSLPELSMIATADYPTPARRPANSVLDTTRIEAVYGITPRPWLIGLGVVLDTLIGVPAEAAR